MLITVLSNSIKINSENSQPLKNFGFGWARIGFDSDLVKGFVSIECRDISVRSAFTCRLRCSKLRLPVTQRFLKNVYNFHEHFMLNDPNAVFSTHAVTLLLCRIPPNYTCGISVCLITVRKRSCGRVMFSQACVKNSVHRGVSASVHAGIHHPSGQTATAADGTHPTGMHSCISAHFAFFHLT